MAYSRSSDPSSTPSTLQEELMKRSTAPSPDKIRRVPESAVDEIYREFQERFATTIRRKAAKAAKAPR